MPLSLPLSESWAARAVCWYGVSSTYLPLMARDTCTPSGRESNSGRWIEEEGEEKRRKEKERRRGSRRRRRRSRRRRNRR